MMVSSRRCLLHYLILLFSSPPLFLSLSVQASTPKKGMLSKIANILALKKDKAGDVSHAPSTLTLTQP